VPELAQRRAADEQAGGEVGQDAGAHHEVAAFLPLSPWIVACDLVVGACVLADFAARLLVSRSPVVGAQ
jgi:hypothetical protein